MARGGHARRPSAAQFVVRVRYHDGRAETFTLDREHTPIGSAGDGIVLDDAGVCPDHAELVFRDGLVGVRDRGSKRGTWVCGRRVGRSVLRPGQWFRVGHTRFELLEVREGTPEEFATQLWQVRGAGDPSAAVSQIAEPAEPAALPLPIVDTTVVREDPSPRPPLMVVPDGAALAPVIIADADPTSARWLHQALAPRFRCTAAATAAEALALASASPRSVVIVGRRIAGGSAEGLVATLARAPFEGRATIIAAGEVAVADAGLFYRVRPGLSPEHLARIVASAARLVPPTASAPLSSTRAWSNKLVFEICATVSARADAAAAAAAIEDGMSRLVRCARAVCVFVDAESGALWTESGDTPIEGTAASGLVGFVARTGLCVHVANAAADPRYDRRVDDPRGIGHEAIVAVPAGMRGETHAVLVAVREPTQGDFEAKACESLAQLGRELGPILHRLGNAVVAQGALERMQRPKALALFRPEAVAAHHDDREQGEVIRIAGHWTQASYWTLLAVLVVGLLGITFGSVSQYSAGPAVIRQRGRAELTALGAGVIAELAVEPGQRVRAGQVLARLRDVSERAEYDAIRNDFHAQLRNRLLDPTDEAAAAQVRALERQLEGAAAALEAKVVRAGSDGIVSDVAVEPGQHVDPGDVVMAVVDDRVPGLEIIALLPGGDRPQIGPGMDLRLELLGYDYAYQDVVVESISEGVIGPNEAKRMLGVQLADTLPLPSGGLVMVRARLPTSTFESDGERYPYHDGMGGNAEVRIRDETVLEMLIPAVKEL